MTGPSLHFPFFRFQHFPSARDRSSRRSVAPYPPLLTSLPSLSYAPILIMIPSSYPIPTSHLSPAFRISHLIGQAQIPPPSSTPFSFLPISFPYSAACAVPTLSSVIFLPLVIRSSSLPPSKYPNIHFLSFIIHFSPYSLFGRGIAIDRLTDSSTCISFLRLLSSLHILDYFPKAHT